MITTIKESNVPADHDAVEFRTRPTPGKGRDAKARRKARQAAHAEAVKAGTTPKAERAKRRALNRADHVQAVREGRLPLRFGPEHRRVVSLRSWADSPSSRLPDFDSMSRDALRAAARDMNLPNYSAVRGSKGSLLAAVKDFASKGRS